MISLGRKKKRSHEVFGVSPDVLPDSYVDRGPAATNLGTLDEAKVYEEQRPTLHLDDEEPYLAACLTYVKELNAVYQTFANRVSSGIRTRRDTTGIYAHAMAVVLDESDDEELFRGVGIDKIYRKAMTDSLGSRRETSTRS